MIMIYLVCNLEEFVCDKFCTFVSIGKKLELPTARSVKIFFSVKDPTTVLSLWLEERFLELRTLMLP